MTGEETVHLTRSAYQAMLTHIEDLEDRVAALEADDGSHIPHSVALAITRGQSPLVAFRTHRGLTLRELARRAGISSSYLSEIERGRKPGAAAALAKIAAALAKIAAALDTTIDALLSDRSPA